MVTHTLIAWAILILLVFFLIFRSKYPNIPVWSFMSFLAFLSVAGGLVNIEEIPSAIDLNVIFFLIGMFSIIALAESSGLLDLLSHYVISKFKSTYAAIIGTFAFFGLLTSVAVNDTMAVMAPPIVYFISKHLKIPYRQLLILLAFSITIGSVMTPMGNPQNVLIAIGSGMSAPFIYFIEYLFLPTIINLVITSFLVIKIYKIPNNSIDIGTIPEEKIKNKKDAILAAIGIFSVIVAMIVNDILRVMGKPSIEQIGFIPFIIASSLYFFVSEPRSLIKEVDWGTIIFFITMFIAMDGVWKSGVASELLRVFIPSKPSDTIAPVLISIISIILSQLFSNVPFVKLFMDYMRELGYTANNIVPWISLAMSSTIAGNLTLFGAASNIIILEISESRYKETIPFSEFFKIGFPVTLLNLTIYLFYIYLTSYSL
ncbi:SLC13 family permease [Fervidicoccus fontis]|nr:SLC13 family permease [Fervidicoccus fontis]